MSIDSPPPRPAAPRRAQPLPAPPHPTAPRQDRAPAERRPFQPQELVEIRRALAQRDRPALRRLWVKFSTVTMPADEMKWVFRLGVAAGEFEKADKALQPLLARGEIEFADACLALQVRRILGLDADVAALFAGTVLDQAVDPSPQQLAQLASAAAALFASGRQAEAAPLLDYADRHADAGPSVDQVQLGKALMASRRFDRAFETLHRADREQPLDEDALCRLADVATIVGETDVAEAAFRRLLEGGHRSVYFLERYLDFSVRQGRSEQATRLLNDMSGRLPADVHARLSILAGMAGRDLDQVLAAVSLLPAEALRTLGNRLAEFGYAILNAGRLEEIAGFEAFLGTLGGELPELLQLTIDLAFRRQDFAAAAQAIERGERLEDEGRAPLFRLKRAELQAFTARLDEAVATIASLGPLRDLPAGYLSPIVAIFAEAGQWRHILTLVEARLDEWFIFDSHGAAVLSAAAAEHGWDVLTAAVERSEERTANLEVRKLKLVMLERLSDPTELLGILEHYEANGLDGYAARLQVRMRALSAQPLDQPPEGASAPARKHAIYYCTDRGYLSPALNSICSLLLTNQAGLDELAIYLFVEDEDVEVAEQVAGALRRRFGCSLTILSVRPLLAGFDGAFKTSYGLFTGGKQLSAAAYYRIFAIRHLLGTDVKRVLYVDSDTLVTGEISRIFAALDGTTPLAARPEVDKLDVRRVEDLHGLRRGTFFNSGVLLFDMEHADLPARIDRTIVEIVENADKLVYHDQCALNRGFADATTPLPTSYNSFCTSHDGLSSPGATGIILHFLDRPKPWQAGYSGPFGAFWYRYWRELAETVEPEVMRRLLARSPV